jgi:hypothetical protein
MIYNLGICSMGTLKSKISFPVYHTSGGGIHVPSNEKSYGHAAIKHRSKTNHGERKCVKQLGFNLYACSFKDRWWTEYKPSKFSMDNAWTSKPTCTNIALEIPTSNKHCTSRWKNQFCVHMNVNFVGSFITGYNSFWFSYRAQLISACPFTYCSTCFT